MYVCGKKIIDNNEEKKIIFSLKITMFVIVFALICDIKIFDHGG